MQTPPQKRVAGALLINSEGKVLLQHRDNIPTISSPDHWTLFGGHIEAGESPDEGIQREILEEIAYTMPYFQHLATLDSPRHLAYIYLAPIDKTCEELELHEGQDFAFFTPQEAKSTLKITKLAYTSLGILELYQEYRLAIGETTSVKNLRHPNE